MRKEEYNKRKAFIDQFVNNYDDEEYQKMRVYEDKIEEENKKKNSICPKCKHTDIIQVFRRPKGEIHGSVNGSSNFYHSSWVLGSNASQSSSIEGKLDGELDTYRVNQCKHCGHEWEIEKEELCIFSTDYYTDKIDYREHAIRLADKVVMLMRDVEKFDPDRLDNKHENVEEFIKDEVENILYWSHISPDTMPLEVLYYFVKRNGWKLIKRESVLKEYPYDDGGEDYMGEFQPEFEEFLIKHFGFKRHFE